MSRNGDPLRWAAWVVEVLKHSPQALKLERVDDDLFIDISSLNLVHFPVGQFPQDYTRTHIEQFASIKIDSKIVRVRATQRFPEIGIQAAIERILTLGTYLREDKVFFPCDFFGSHLATSSLFVDDEPRVYEAAKRYYAEIMMPFRGPIKNNLEKIEAIEIEMIAPSHGPVYDKPEFIIDAYKDWVSDGVKNEVVLAYVSMHNSTRKMAEYFANALIERSITVRQFDLTVTDIGKLAISLVDAATLVIGSPTVLTGAHPVAAYAAILANVLRPKTKFASIIGSYGWGGKMVEQITGLIGNLKAELLEPVIAKGHPKDDDFTALDKLADEILAKHKGLKIVN